MARITRAQAGQFIGREIYVLKRNGSAVHGKLTGLQGDKLMMAPIRGKAQIRAFLPLALFDVLAIGTAPFAGFGGGFGGFGGVGVGAFAGFGVGAGFGGGFGGFGPGFFW